jgi:outer membrane protein TolC
MLSGTTCRARSFSSPSDKRTAVAPTIGVAPSISTVRDSPNQPYSPSSQANNGTGDFTLPVDMSWEIDLWGRIRRSVTAAGEQTQASAADMAASRLSAETGTSTNCLRSNLQGTRSRVPGAAL